MEHTFPSDFAGVRGCESKQGQPFRDKMSSFLHLCFFIFNYFLLQKDQLGFCTKRRRAAIRLILLFFFKTRLFCLFLTVMLPEHC